MAFFVGEEAAEVNIDLPAAARVAFFDAEEVDVVHLVAHVLDVENAVGGKQHGGDVLHGLAALAEVDGVLVGEVLAGALFGAEVADAEADGELEDDDRVGAEAAQYAGHVGIEAGEDGADADDGAGADDDAEHGEEGAQLVRADGLRRRARVR